MLLGCVDSSLFTQARNVWHRIPLVPLRRDAIDAAVGGVAHAVAADAAIVPVGHEDAAVRGHADIARPEPVVAAGQQYFLVEFVARPFWFAEEPAHLARAGVAMEQRTGVLLGEERAL